jgi:hypothetical protein
MSPDLFETDRRTDFEAFWQLYPRHQARKDALKAWLQLAPDDDTIDRIMTNLRVRTWPDQQRFIPLAGTFLRGYRWTDDPLMGNRPTPPANRWEPTSNSKRMIPGGMGITCEHEPMCQTDMDCYHRRQNDRDLA